MFDRNDVRTLHMETSTVCNAACPMCARESDPFFDKKNDATSLSLAKVKEIFDNDFIGQLNYMFMCGNYGDPAAAPDCIEIFRHFRSVNNNITLGMNSNGSLRNEKWWAELGSILSKNNDNCYFGIDGLSDTNHIYRVNTNYDKIMKNAKAFIESGGKAYWKFLVFEHNEHQVEEAKELSKLMGFTRFEAVVTARLDSPRLSHLINKFKLPKNKVY
jgi:MoaA/NifB/PqqE/SkfB family radical SAM enzyme